MLFSWRTLGRSGRYRGVDVPTNSPDFAAVFSRLPLGDLSGSCWLINESVFAFIAEDVIS